MVVSCGDKILVSAQSSEKEHEKRAQQTGTYFLVGGIGRQQSIKIALVIMFFSGLFGGVWGYLGLFGGYLGAV